MIISSAEFKKKILNKEIVSIDGKLKFTSTHSVVNEVKPEKAKKKKPICPVTGIEFDSMGEIYIYWWLLELRDNGFVESIELQPEPFILSSSVYRDIEINGKSKKEFIIHGHHYTADFKVKWTPKTLEYGFVNEFYSKIKRKQNELFCVDLVSYLEAKPDGLDLKKTIDANNMVRLFSNKQKEVFDKFNVLVELVYHNNLFHKTFLPERYISQDKGRDKRSIKYNYKILKDLM